MTPATFRHTVTYTGPRAALAAIRALYTENDEDAGDGIRRTASLSKLRPVRLEPVAKPRPANWSGFRLAGALSALTDLAITRLPDPRDDADLREAVALLTAIRRRQEERKNLNVENKR